MELLKELACMNLEVKEPVGSIVPLAKQGQAGFIHELQQEV